MDNPDLNTLTTAAQSLRNQFLVAMPGLNDDSFFARTVTLMCEHNAEGALGLIINHPLPMTFSDLFRQLDLPCPPRYENRPILFGGPVQPGRGFILHRPGTQRWSATYDLSADVCLTTSRDILDDISRDEGPDDVLIMLGYAGWDAGQLEAELVDNAWLTTPANTDILFHTPFEERAAASAALLGIDLNLLPSQAGHA